VLHQKYEADHEDSIQIVCNVRALVVTTSIEFRIAICEGFWLRETFFVSMRAVGRTAPADDCRLPSL
jgi:hypothetical protein